MKKFFTLIFALLIAGSVCADDLIEELQKKGGRNDSNND